MSKTINEIDAEIKKTLGVFIAKKVSEKKINCPTQATYNNAYSSRKLLHQHA